MISFVDIGQIMDELLLQPFWLVVFTTLATLIATRLADERRKISNKQWRHYLKLSFLAPFMALFALMFFALLLSLFIYLVNVYSGGTLVEKLTVAVVALASFDIYLWKKYKPKKPI